MTGANRVSDWLAHDPLGQGIAFLAGFVVLMAFVAATHRWKDKD